MTFSIWEDPTLQGALRGTFKTEALAELCERKQTCTLATNFFSIESRFLERVGEELHLRASISQESARYTLVQQPLKIRFPWALTYFAGVTRFLGYDQTPQQRVLRLTVPDVLEMDELRGAFRLENVGRSPGAISCSTGEILRVSLENISTLGAGVFSFTSIPEDGFQTGRLLSLSLSLERGPDLHLNARVIHDQEQHLGLKFEPFLESIDPLKSWMEPRVEETKRRWLERTEIRAKSLPVNRPKAAPTGILLLSKDSRLAEQLVEILEGTLPLRTCLPVTSLLREILDERPPLLILLDTAEGDVEDRHRYKKLFEALAPTCPILALGRGEDIDRCRSLATELKATLFTEWKPQQSAFFLRLVQGVIQRYG